MSRYQYVDPDVETKSLVQPGRQVFDYQLPPALPGTLRILGESIAKGRFTTVYKGEWSCPGKEIIIVVMKQVKLPGGNVNNDHFRTRIKRETVIWTTTIHPNILPFIGYQIIDNAPVLVTEWHANGNLSRYLGTRPIFTRSEKIDLLCRTARGLLHLHNLDPQIIHGDIKPENVIVQDNLEPALCDFGISKLHVDTSTGLSSGAGGVRGGFEYRAKEVLQEELATSAIDVYAFGGLILSAMSGKPPFWNQRPLATILAIVNDNTPDPSDHPQLPADDPLWNLLSACWSGIPGDRPNMLKVLQEIEVEREIDELRPEPPPSPGVSTDEEESLVRPGYFVFNRELPKPISGTLIKTGELARGGFGDVYRGLWVRPNADSVSVVIKCVRPSDDTRDEKFRLRVKRETLIWSMVEHPNILPFIGYQTIDELPMLVSPWCKNGNLDIYTKTHPKLLRSDKLELLRGAARGLLHLHSLKPPIFHGDLKPQNILVQDNLEAALSDFGNSRVLNPGEHSHWNASVAFGGTKGYESAEIIDEGPPTTAADVYAFAGVILATMSGTPPFWKKSATATAIAVAKGHTPDPKDHSRLPEPDNLWILMRECWSYEPDSRPRMSELLNHLDDEISQR